MLQNLYASEEIINNVNVTKLKEEILKRAPTLCEQRNGKFILLTLDRQVGKALFNVTQNSHKDDSIMLPRVAKIKRKHMFDKEEILNGDLSREKQEDCVPSPLLRLISLIFNKSTILNNYNANSKTVAVKRIVCPRNIEKKDYLLLPWLIMLIMTHLLLQLNVYFMKQVYQCTRNESNLPYKKFIYKNKTDFKWPRPELPENYTNIMPANVVNLSFQVTNSNQEVFSLLNSLLSQSVIRCTLNISRRHNYSIIFFSIFFR